MKVILKYIALLLVLTCNTYANTLIGAASSKALSLRHVERLNQDVTFFGIGALEIGRDWGIGKTERLHPAERSAEQTINLALQKGINVYDTATSYHLSEERLGKIIAKSKLRNQILIMSKPGEHSILAIDKTCKKPAYDKIFCNQPASQFDFSAAAIRRDIETSLKRLNISHFDVAFIHFDQQTAKDVLDKGEAVATLKQLQKEGKIRHIGASLDGALAKRAILSNDFDAIQMEYNLLNQSNKENIKLAKDKGMLVIIRGSLGTGLLTSQVAPYLTDPNLPFKQQVEKLLALTKGDFNKLTALALAFVYKNKDISSIIVGVSRPEQLQQDITLLDQFKDEQLLQQAENLMAQYKPKDYTYIVDKYFAEKY